MKGINLIKMLFPSINPPYVSWFYLNQSNFFWGEFSLLNVSSKKKEKKGQKEDGYQLHGREVTNGAFP